MNDPTLSIVIASYGRAAHLDGCLNDLEAQDTDRHFEVILVLQAYPDGAGAAYVARHPSLDIRVREFPGGLGTARARNAGLALARGDLVAFLDDDVRLPAHWVREMISFYKDPAIGAVGGFVDHPGHYNVLRRAVYRVLGITASRYKVDWGGFNVGPAHHPTADQPAEWLSGGNMSFRTTAIRGVGGFDETIGSFWHEDVDVAHRVAASGWRMVSSRRVAVDHYPSTVNRPPLHEQMLERERTRVRFVRRAIGDEPLWRVRYGTRLALHALAMAVIGISKLDPRIPLNVIRGGVRGYRESQEILTQRTHREGRPV